MEALYTAYKDRAEFFLVYIREAHPSDGPRPDRDKRYAASQPKTFEQRTFLASRCVSELRLSLPVLIDDMDGTVERAYRAWPDRLCVVGVDGKVVYYGGQGPGGFKPSEAEAALKALVGK